MATAFRLLPYLNNFSNLEYRIPVSAKKREKERRGEIEKERERERERDSNRQVLFLTSLEPLLRFPTGKEMLLVPFGSKHYIRIQNEARKVF